MTRTLLFCFGLISSLGAQAQTFTTESESVLNSWSSPGLELGVLDPAVVFNPANATLTMFFSTPRVVVGCNTAYAIGFATSTDGLSWNVNPDTLLEPAPGTAASCGMTGPSAVVEGDTWRLWFTATDDAGVQTPGVLLAGPGIRVLRPTSGAEGVVDVSVAKLGNEYLMIGLEASSGDLLSLRSPDGLSWTADATTALASSSIPWASDGYYSPSIACESGMMFPWTLRYGGGDGTATDWGYSVSGDGNYWYVSPAFGTWAAADTGWLSFDVLDSPDASVAWYEEVGPDGLSQISVASTDTWSVAALRGRVCQ